MKAIQMSEYGDSSVLKWVETEKPVMQPDEILIKIAATSINPLDMKVRSGKMKEIMPISFPFIPGVDLAGVVKSVGENTTKIKVGDSVFATTFGGTYAEFVSLKESVVATIPQNVNATEAAALAIPITTAYTLLVQTIKIKPGDKILVQGAAGGVGTVLVQVAKALGAHVTATASGEGIGLLQNLGADVVIDYKKEDFRELVSDIDLVVDMVGGPTQEASFAVLKKGGTLLSIVMPPSEELASQYGVTAQFVNSDPGAEKLEFGKELVEDGKIKTQITQVLTLKDAARAQDIVSSGGVHGKVILAVE